MKNIFKFSALFCAMTFMVTSCSQDAMFEPEAPQQKPILDGDEIIFGSRAGFENANPDTRTVYSGETYDIGEGDNKKTFERIDWAEGDQVEIYCPQSVSMTNAHYKVNQNSVDENGSGNNDVKDEGWLEKIDPEGNGLAWNGDGDHEFYAMYPSFDMLSDDEKNTLNQGVKMNKTVLTGVVPKAQSPKSVVKSGTTYTAEPDMRYAYMAAKTVTTKAKATAADGAVKLDFVPVVTALQIELQAQNVPVEIKEIQVVSGDKSGIVGSFTADLSDAGWPAGATYPDCTKVSDSNESDILQYSLPDPVTLGINESLVFTVFLRPDVDYKNVTVRFSPTGAGYLSNQLGNDKNNVTIPAMKKTIVNDFLLPKTTEELEIDVSHWLDQLPDDYRMGYLSLPGTGGSFTSKYSGSNPNYFQQQTLPVVSETVNDNTIKGQWECGIRAFELSVDRQIEIEYLFGVIPVPQDNSATTLADAPILCNKQDVGITFDEAMTMICNKVNGTQECAVVTISYQPVGATPSRNCERFVESLKLWWNTAEQTIYELYSPDMTLEKARGKVLVLVRLNQQDEKDGGTIVTALSNVPAKFVALDGCGTAKDRWGARGYKINNVECVHISNEKSGNDNVLENHMIREPLKFSETSESTFAEAASPITNYTIYRPGFKIDSFTDIILDNNAVYTEYIYSESAKDKVIANATYSTNQSFSCVYQEWARVVKTPMKNQAWDGDYADGTISWFESLNEKKANIQCVFERAISSDPVSSKKIYINSLSGYLVTSAYDRSYIPSQGREYGGDGGDIEGLANELNPWFAKLVSRAGIEQSTGPTGVIYIDRVTTNMDVIGAIISNNFKHSITQ